MQVGVNDVYGAILPLSCHQVCEEQPCCRLWSLSAFGRGHKAYRTWRWKAKLLDWALLALCGQRNEVRSPPGPAILQTQLLLATGDFLISMA